jgi:hypothetical protein
MPDRAGSVRRVTLLLTGAVVAAVLVGFLAELRSSSPPEPARLLPEQGVQESSAGDAMCASYCSEARPGLSVAEVRFAVSAQPLGAAELASAVGARGLDVSVYEDGFSRGLFARVGSITPQAEFAVAESAGQVAIPGLDTLVVTDVVTSRDQDQPERLRLFRHGPESGGPEAVVVQIEGLQPGLNYFWRVPTPDASRTDLVACQAATCPMDWKPAPPRPE